MAEREISRTEQWRRIVGQEHPARRGQYWLYHVVQGIPGVGVGFKLCVLESAQYMVANALIQTFARRLHP